MRITHKVTLLGLGVFIASALVLIIVLSQTLPQDLSRLLLQEQQAKAELLVAQAEGELDDRRNALQQLAHMLVVDDRPMSIEQLNQRLQQSILTGRYFNGGLAFFDTEGQGVAEAPRDSGRIGLDISDREHLRQARATLQPVITQPLLSRSLGLPSFFINVPVLDSRQQLQGFLVGVTILERDNFLLKVGREAAELGGIYYVLDEANGLIVTASDPSLAMQPLPETGDNPLIDAVRAGQASGQARHSHHREYIFATATLPQMGWKVVRAIPAEHVHGPVSHLTRELSVYALLLALLAGLLLFVLLRRMLAPLGKATASINAMSAGQCPYTLLSHGSDDEVGELVEAFNHLFESHEEQRQRLALATSGSGVGIWDYRVETGQLIWDENMFALYGIDMGDFRGAYAVWEEGVHPDDRPEARRKLEQAISGEGGFDTEFRVVHPTGEVRWIKANGSVLRDADGKATRVLGTNWDITERKRIELMKGQFISTVSHELRTPLTSIRGALGLACGGQLGDIPEQALPMLQIALRNSEHLTELVNDLLDMEKLSSGEMCFEMQAQPLWPLLVEAVASGEAYAAQHQVSLHLLPADESLQVEVDGQRLRQVMNNLLSNAAKFSPPQAEVRISLSAEQGRVRVAVQDQGPGVPPAFRSRIFQRFAQADASDTRQKGGTGLGLAISRELIERMGGEIGYHSPPGEGATFYFELPLIGSDDIG